MRPLPSGIAAALLIAAFPATTFAQFGDIPTDRQRELEERLEKLKGSCAKGEGRACHDIAEMLRKRELAVSGSAERVRWALLEEACSKKHQKSCAMVAKQRRDEAARREAYLAADNRRRAAESAAPESRGAQASAHAEGPRSRGLGSVLSTIAVVGSGVAAGWSVGKDATDAQRMQAMTDAMLAMATALGDEDLAAALQGGAVTPSGSPESSSAATAEPGNATGLSGTWAYNGPMAPKVRHLLRAVPRWACPVGPQDRGISPRMPVRPSSQRDQYVAAAVTSAWAIECYSRQGKQAQAREVEPILRSVLNNANNLCSGASAMAGGRAPATLAVWGCPPPIR